MRTWECPPARMWTGGRAPPQRLMMYSTGEDALAAVAVSADPQISRPRVAKMTISLRIGVLPELVGNTQVCPTTTAAGH